MNFICVYNDICSHIPKVKGEGSKCERENGRKEESRTERETEKEKEMQKKG